MNSKITPQMKEVLDSQSWTVRVGQSELDTLLAKPSYKLFPFVYVSIVFMRLFLLFYVSVHGHLSMPLPLPIVFVCAYICIWLLH